MLTGQEELSGIGHSGGESRHEIGARNIQGKKELDTEGALDT